MKNIVLIFLLFCTNALFAQDNLELTPNGFVSVTISRPDKTNEKLIEASKGWANSYIREQHDVFEVTENAMRIDALRDNAFFYRNLGETFKYKIRYALQISFEEKVCKVIFVVKEIYAGKTLTKTTVADFFTADGKLREDYEEVKPSLELTANKIIHSYADFISR